MPIVVIPTGGSLGVVTPQRVARYVNPAPPSAGIVYTANGERWDAIAFKMYGDPTQLGLLIQNNPGIPIGDYVAAGTRVFVPLLTPVSSVTSSTPWG